LVLTPCDRHIDFNRAGAIIGDSVSVHGTLEINNFIIVL